MIIKKIHINAFGKLKNYDLDLQSGLNVVYGANEYGKSTIMDFIKMIFYSKLNKSKNGINLRKKYIPWSGESGMGGYIEFEHNGKIYNVQKSISGRSASYDKCSVQDRSTGEILNLGKNEEIGERFFGIDLKTFERSAYISRIGGLDFSEKPSSSSKDMLTDRLFSNLTETGEDDISQSEIETRLSSAINDLRTKTGNGGKIYRIGAEIENLKIKISDLNSAEKSQEKIKKEIEELDNLISEQKELSLKSNMISNFERCKKLTELLGLMSERRKIEADIEKYGIKISDRKRVVGELSDYAESLSKIDSENKSYINMINGTKDETIEITDGDMQKFENCRKKYDYLKNKSENLKYIFAEPMWNNFSDDISGLKEIKSDMRKLEASKISKSDEIAKCKSTLKTKIWATILILVSMLVLCGFLIFSKMNFFAVVVGVALAALSIPLWISRLKQKKRIEDLSSEEKSIDNRIEDLKAKFEAGVANYKSAITAEFEGIKREFQSILSSKNCKDARDYYWSYARCKEIEKMNGSLKKTTEKREQILNELKKYLAENSINMSAESISEDLTATEDLLRTYNLISDKIGYRSESLNVSGMTEAEINDTISKLRLSGILDLSAEDVAHARERLHELNSMGLSEERINKQRKIVNLGQDMEKFEQELSVLTAKKQNMERYLKYLQTAKQAFDESVEELRGNFSPKLNARASEIFNILTSGKYSEMAVQKDYNLILEADNMRHASENFSSGTIDQAYLALRIAISETLCSEDVMPLIFDDTLMQYDDIRLENALRFLNDYAISNGTQVIIFTCHKYIRDLINNV